MELNILTKFGNTIFKTFGMKKIYGLLLLMLGSIVTAVAQPTLTQANFVHNVGDTVFYYLADTNTTVLNPTVGANVVFDYTEVKSLSLSQTTQYLDPATTPGAADFPTADYAEKSDANSSNYLYSKSDADSLLTLGFIADIVGFGDVTAKYDVDPETVMKFPFNYGDSYTDNYAGEFSTLYNGIFPVSTDGEGYVTVNADAWGRLDMPFSVTFDSVIRVTRVEHVVTDTIFLPGGVTINPLTIDATVVSYYKPSESKSPLLSFIEGSYKQDGNVVDSNKTIISQYPLIVGIEELEFAKAINLYPNPTTNGATTLSFDLLKKATRASIVIKNNLGQTVQEIYTGSLSSGKNTFNIETAAFSAGIYFINMLVDDAKITRKLIVE